MKLVSLMSSGIDSPIATYLFSKKAEEIILIHAYNKPFTDNREKENFIRLGKHLKTQGVPIKKAYIVPHGATLTAYQQICERRFTCVFCKRMMLRYAEKIAEQKHAEAIIMGDSLGQVASQTLQNIRVIEQAVDLPVLRPLIGLDKEDIVQIAKDIKTYDFSIVPSGGCTATPDKPATKAVQEQIVAEEKKIDVDELVRQALQNASIVKF